MPQDRRTFLKRSGAALSVAAVSGCAPDVRGRGSAGGERLDPALLRAVAQIALPSELDDNARESAVDAFERWAYGYDPVPELNHGYGTSEIRYGPPDPVPGWSAQLDALELESRRRHATDFVALEPAAREGLLRRHLSGAGGGLPNPLRAEHVALALLAHWFASADALDRCYRRRIALRACRGIETAPQEPEAIA